MGGPGTTNLVRVRAYAETTYARNYALHRRRAITFVCVVGDHELWCQERKTHAIIVAYASLWMCSWTGDGYVRSERIHIPSIVDHPSGMRLHIICSCFMWFNNVVNYWQWTNPCWQWANPCWQWTKHTHPHYRFATMSSLPWMRICWWVHRIPTLRSA